MPKMLLGCNFITNQYNLKKLIKISKNETQRLFQKIKSIVIKIFWEIRTLELMFGKSEEIIVTDEERMYSQINKLSRMTRDYENLYQSLQKITVEAAKEPPRGVWGWFLRTMGIYKRDEIVRNQVQEIDSLSTEGNKLINDIIGSARIAHRAIQSINEQAIGRIKRLEQKRAVKQDELRDTVIRYQETIRAVTNYANVDSSLKEFVDWIQKTDLKNVDSSELTRHRIDLTDVGFDGAFSKEVFYDLSLDERLYHEERWRTLVQKSEAEESSKSEGNNAEKLRAFTSKHEVICEQALRKFSLEIDRFDSEVSLLKSAIALNEINKLRSQIKEQSEKLAFIREELVFRIEQQYAAERHAARRYTDTRQQYNTGSDERSDTIDIDAKDIF